MNFKSLHMIVFLSLVVFAVPALAGNPAPLFNKPIKLDDSGRPLYNSWERQEYERRKRAKRRKRMLKKSSVSSKSAVKTNATGSGTAKSSLGQNTAAPSSTPSSVITNRPVQNGGDPNVADDFDF